MKVLTKIYNATSFLRIFLIFVAVSFNLYGITCIINNYNVWYKCFMVSIFFLVCTLINAVVNGLSKSYICFHTLTTFCNSLKREETKNDDFYEILKKQDNKYLINIYDELYSVELHIHKKGIAVTYYPSLIQIKGKIFKWDKEVEEFTTEQYNEWEGINWEQIKIKEKEDMSLEEGILLLMYLEDMQKNKSEEVIDNNMEEKKDLS